MASAIADWERANGTHESDPESTLKSDMPRTAVEGSSPSVGIKRVQQASLPRLYLFD